MIGNHESAGKAPSENRDAGQSQALPGVEKELLSDVEAGFLCGVSRRTWHRLNATGDCPSPVQLPGVRARRWRRSDILKWIEAGCPERAGDGAGRGAGGG